MVKYKSRMGAITKHEILRETPKQVVLERKSWDGKTYQIRESKRTDFHQWHDSWEDAHEFLVRQKRQKIAYIKEQLGREEKKLIELESWTEPKED